MNGWSIPKAKAKSLKINYKVNGKVKGYVKVNFGIVTGFAAGKLVYIGASVDEAKTLVETN